MSHPLTLLAALVLPLGALAADKKIVLIAGKPSHPPGAMDFPMFPTLDQVNANKETVVGGWDSVVGANVVE